MNAAQRLAAYGRNGDNNLVHVSNRELQGIEALTGRKFTRNPDTGLPEAFNFADLLPVAAGIGATLLTGGTAAPLVGAAAAGATRAGVSAAQGKEAGAALMDGLITGATSYATAGLMQGVGAAGVPGGDVTAATAQAGQQAASQAASQGASLSSGLGTSLPAADPGFAGQAAMMPVGASMPVSDPGFMGQSIMSSAEAASAAPAATPASVFQGATAGEKIGYIGNALQNDPTGSLGQLASRQGLVALGGTAAQLSGMMAPPAEPASPASQYDPSKRRTNPAVPRNLRSPGPDYRPGMDGEFRYFAEGGLAELPTSNVPQYNDALNVLAEARAAMLGEHPASKDAMRRLDEQMGPDTVRSVREEGGRVRGAGGGLDDLVPGTIEGRQEVRLADGEFVIPADVVSALGDGSTDQGARKLHEMMNRVRKQKTGSTEQPGRVSDKVFPA